MTTKNFCEAVENELKNFINDKVPDGELSLEVISVWYSKSIRNHKGTFIVRNANTEYIFPFYFECTYNGNKKELYVVFIINL